MDERDGVEQAIREAMEELSSAIRERDGDRLEITVAGLDLLLPEVDSWPAAFIERLHEIVADPNFLVTRKSWAVLHFINLNWLQFSAHNTQVFREILARTFDGSDDWMHAFIASEILGEHFADADTLHIFIDLLATAKLPDRSLVPHGLEHLAKTTPDETLRNRAITILKQLESDPYDAVRDEATQALYRLDAKG